MNHINRLYIHVPFCQNKCAYCAFHSIPISATDTLINNYFTKLEKDIKESQHLTTPLQSIFIGGGTPSCLKADDIEKLFTIISDNFRVADNAEITIESNPESLTEEKVSVIASFANRVSIGIQSFNKNHRSIIGRIGNNKNIINIIETFIKNNVDNISADLIYGIPTQTIEDWEKELITALQLPIKHLSTYALTIEEGTKLSSNKNLNLTEIDNITAEMWNFTSNLLLQSGFNRYEISNYSLPGFECKHNLDTWFGGTYLGLGPTASSFDGKTRWTQPKLNEWLKDEKPEIDSLSTRKRTMEIFIMGLRTTHGWVTEKKDDESILFTSQFTHNLSLKIADWEIINRKLFSLHKAGLLKIKNINSSKTQIFPTEKGLLFWNEVAMELI